MGHPIVHSLIKVARLRLLRLRWLRLEWLALPLIHPLASSALGSGRGLVLDGL
jgi:hypothetical protein